MNEEQWQDWLDSRERVSRRVLVAVTLAVLVGGMWLWWVSL